MRAFPVSESDVSYFGCNNCGFVFTNYMDEWTHDDFKTFVYNDEYFLADAPLPGYEAVDRRGSISYQNGKRLAGMLRGSEQKIRVLDYGAGGNPGDTGLALLDAGFSLDSYEPFLSEEIGRPVGKYHFIYLIEVIEHCHDIHGVARELAELLTEDGLLHIQTLLHPCPVPKDVLASWYIAPRNGHISIFSFESLSLLFRPYGVNIVSTLHGVFGFKNKPTFKNAVFI